MVWNEVKTRSGISPSKTLEELTNTELEQLSAELTRMLDGISRGS